MAGERSKLLPIGIAQIGRSNRFLVWCPEGLLPPRWRQQVRAVLPPDCLMQALKVGLRYMDTGKRMVLEDAAG